MKIGIIGLGLIGGSIAKTLKQFHAQNSWIVAYDTNQDSLNQALHSGIINKIAPAIGSDFKGCNVIFVCTPVKKTTESVQLLLKYVSRDCIITDVSSTKYQVLSEIEEIVKNHHEPIYFVGGHPMAGSEKNGFSAATDYLFENAYYIITPYPSTPDFIIFIMQKLIERLGAIPITIPASYHDFATATISHVPHIIAAGLVHLVKTHDNEKHYLHTLAAGGFKDITRIASSNPTIWESICLTNRDKILDVLTDYIEILSDFKEELEAENSEEIFNYFLGSKSYRDTFRDGVQNGFTKTYALFVDAKDQPGAIATLATLLSSRDINIKDIGVVNHREFDSGILRIVFATSTDRIKSHEILSSCNYNVYC